MSKRRRGSRVRKRTAGEWLRIKRNKRKVGALVAVVVIVVAMVAALKMFVRPPEIKLPVSPTPTPTTPVETPPEETDVTETMPPPETIPAESQTVASVEGRKDGYYTILVVGQDTTSGSTDTMMLVTLDTIDKTCSVMSLPRDTMVNIPESVKKLNSVYNLYGMDGLREQVGKLTGVVPDFSVMIQWEAVGTLVDAIGGVWYDVPYNMNYEDPEQNLYIHVDAGYQLLDGDLAMQVVRWRKNNDGSGGDGSDTGRMERQQDFLKAVANQVLDVSNLTKIDKLLQIFNENVETDLSLGNLVWFANEMKSIDTENDLMFCTLPANMDGWYHKSSYVLAYPSEIVEVVNQSFNPYTRDITEGDLEIMGVDENDDLYVTNGVLAG